LGRTRDAAPRLRVEPRASAWSEDLRFYPVAFGGLPFFRRPVANETSSFGDPLEISFSRFVEPARVDLISEIISSYYTSGRATLSPDSGEPDEIENIVLAVWSQQWPRLRSSFSFCTASLNENRRTEQNDYSVQVAPLDEAPSISRERWVSFAAADAALNKVTPLRRFLWRYGRDISASRVSIG
jgi:hypothetical protein